MIFAWDELRELHGQRPALARESLRGQLEAYQDVAGVRVVLVFDGKHGDGGEKTTQKEFR